MPANGRSWVLSKQRYQEYLKDNRIWFGEKGNNVPRVKRFLSETNQTIVPMTIWKYIEVDHSQNTTKELKAIFAGESLFTYPKPVKLLKRCIELYSKCNSTILDFFVGFYVIIVLAVKNLIKSRVLVLLQKIKTLKINNLCVI